MFKLAFAVIALLASGMTLAQQDPMIQELEAQLEEADRLGVTGPEIDQLRDLLEKIKAEEAAANNVAQPSGEATTATETASEPDPRAADQPEAESSDSNDLLAYTSPEGERKTLDVDKSERAQFAGFYANEHQDPAVADFRYDLRADGSAVLEHRVCENCTHELSGEAMSRDWQVQHEAIEWAPMVTDAGEPMMRSVKDMAGETYQARVLIISLQEGGVMALNHYTDAERVALGGPYGVPRYKQ